jgi:hypothetical protein
MSIGDVGHLRRHAEQWLEAEGSATCWPSGATSRSGWTSRRCASGNGGNFAAASLAHFHDRRGEQMAATLCLGLSADRPRPWPDATTLGSVLKEFR